MDSISVLFAFFFQAEDGIRDHCVIGVQTCALPILTAICAGQPFPMRHSDLPIVALDSHTFYVSGSLSPRACNIMEVVMRVPRACIVGLVAISLSVSAVAKSSGATNSRTGRHLQARCVRPAEIRNPQGSRT